MSGADLIPYASGVARLGADGEPLAALVDSFDGQLWARLVVNDAGTFIGTSAVFNTGYTWVSVHGAEFAGLPAVVGMVELEEPGTAADPLRTEDGPGGPLTVLGRPGLYAETEQGTVVTRSEVWVDGGGAVQRGVSVITTMPTAGIGTQRIIVAIRDNDVDVQPPRIRSGDATPLRAVTNNIASTRLVSLENGHPARLAAFQPRPGKTAILAQQVHVALVCTGSDGELVVCPAGVVRGAEAGIAAEVGNSQMDVAATIADLQAQVENLRNQLAAKEARDAANKARDAAVATCNMIWPTIVGGIWAMLTAASMTAPLAVANPIAFAGVLALYLGVSLFFANQMCASVHGEPHIRTFDGNSYGLQAIGEFVHLQSDGLDIQMRFEGHKGTATWTSATAVRLGDHVIESYYATTTATDDGIEILVDGQPTALDESGIWFPDLSGAIRAPGGGRDLFVIAPDGSHVLIQNLSVSQNVVIRLTAQSGRLVRGGLVGLPDGDRSNDFRLRDGTTLPLADSQTIAGLYGGFGDSWRVTPGERLFTQGDPADWTTPEITSLPDTVFGLGNFSPEETQVAREACRAAGVEPGPDLEDCTYDVLVDGERWAGQSADKATVRAPSVGSGGQAFEADHPLLVAADRCVAADIRRLLDSGSDANMRRVADGVTPLMFSAQRGCLEGVEALLEAGGSPSATDDDGIFPLYLAVQNDKTTVVQALLEAGASPDQATHAGDTPLLVAAFRGRLDSARLLIEAGASLDVGRDRDGFTPLLAAVQQNRASVAELLLQFGSDPNRTDYDGLSALMSAAAKGNLELAQLLDQFGADLDLQRLGDGVTAVHFAAQNGHSELVRVLLDRGADADPPDQDGQTPLMLASGRGHVEIVRMLLEGGANPNQARRTDAAASLHFAVDAGHLDVVRALLEDGADVDARRNDGATPLHLAASKDRFPVAVALLDAGADPGAVDGSGRTPADYAGPQTEPLFE